MPSEDSSAELEVSSSEWKSPVPSGNSAFSQIRPRVLVADDNSVMRHYMSRLLSERFEVVGAVDGQAALERARAMRQEGIPPSWC